MTRLLLAAVITLLWSLGAVAAEREPTVLVDDSATPVAGYVARIELDDPAALNAALRRAEQLYLEHGLPEGVPPIAFIIHGPEVKIFAKQNYRQYRDIVDRAARLAAFQMVEVKVCDASRGAYGLLDKPLHPFVGTVRLGPAEIDRLRTKEQYQYF